ncbi:hypothetical protein C8Q80DRAFT_945996 [Daedaleopsis nitida]|nr:hypothetical protein C8Q80DRAFT_945996 [Daedaleopsis nitida]
MKEFIGSSIASQGDVSLLHHARINGPSCSPRSLCPTLFEHRESIRCAISLLCSEMLERHSRARSPSSQDPRDADAASDSETIKTRLRPLATLESRWSGEVAAHAAEEVGSCGRSPWLELDFGDEELEKRLFAEALRDGYVLCRYMSMKLSTGNALAVDRNTKGLVNTSNIDLFLEAACGLGLAGDELFDPHDFLEGTSESLCRVARCILALSRAACTISRPTLQLHTRRSSNSTQQDVPSGRNPIPQRRSSSKLLSALKRFKSRLPTVHDFDHQSRISVSSQPGGSSARRSPILARRSSGERMQSATRTRTR